MYTVYGSIPRMEMTFIQLTPFKAQWDKLRLGDEDLQALEKLILARPEVGAVVGGTGGIRKARFAPPSKGTGKSGALRIGYAHYRVYGIVYLVMILVKKNNEANFTAAEKAELRSIMAALNKFHDQRR